MFVLRSGSYTHYCILNSFSGAKGCLVGNTHSSGSRCICVHLVHFCISMVLYRCGSVRLCPLSSHCKGSCECPPSYLCSLPNKSSFPAFPPSSIFIRCPHYCLSSSTFSDNIFMCKSPFENMAGKREMNLSENKNVNKDQVKKRWKIQFFGSDFRISKLVQYRGA